VCLLATLFVLICSWSGCSGKPGAPKGIDGDDSCGMACNFTHRPTSLYGLLRLQNCEQRARARTLPV
jgi:hypothetical protein